MADPRLAIDFAPGDEKKCELLAAYYKKHGHFGFVNPRGRRAGEKHFRLKSPRQEDGKSTHHNRVCDVNRKAGHRMKQSRCCFSIASSIAASRPSSLKKPRNSCGGCRKRLDDDILICTQCPRRFHRVCIEIADDPTSLVCPHCIRENGKRKRLQTPFHKTLAIYSRFR